MRCPRTLRGSGVVGLQSGVLRGVPDRLGKRGRLGHRRRQRMKYLKDKNIIFETDLPKEVL